MLFLGKALPTKPPRGGFFCSAHHSLNQSACSCVSIHIVRMIINPNHSAM